MKKCPTCGSSNVAPNIGFHTGKYQCNDCGYIGPLIIEEDFSISSAEIRDKFLDFFKKNDHLLIKDSSLIPENDPTALFINSGMHPIKNYFLGLEEPPSKKLCSIQKSFRTADIDDVGFNILVKLEQVRA